MTEDYTSASKFLDISKDLYNRFADVNHTIEKLQSVWQKDPISEQITQDIGKIHLAGKKFQKLHKLLDKYLKTNINPDPEDLKGHRHDLRAAISGILGYGELILEDLEILEEYTTLKKTLRTLLEQSESALECVDLIKLEEANDGFEENNTEDTDYCTLVYTGRILIVDDDPDKLDMLSRRLEQVGHTIVKATDGYKALKALNASKEEIDCIILDMIMPGLDGYSVLLKIKENQKHRDIPVLVISSLSDTKNVIRCIRAGADDYLPMPVDGTLLNARVNSCIYKKLMRDREQKNLKQMDELRQQLSKALESIDEGFAIFDTKDCLISCNSKFKDLYPGVEALGDAGFTYEDLLRENIKLGVYLNDRRQTRNNINNFKTPEEIEDWIKLRLSYYNKADKPYTQLLSSGKWIEIIENKIPGGGTVTVHKDISESIKREEALNYLATHDPLTGLANRTLFDTKLTQALKKAEKNKNIFGIIFFDLDKFKQVNDTLGHEFGDYLLVQVAKHLKTCVREEDTVARMGGDEFAAIIENIEDVKPLKIIAQRCLDAIGTTFTLDGKTAEFGVSIGIASYPLNGKDIRELLVKADKAMYDVKKAGKGTYLFAS